MSTYEVMPRVRQPGYKVEVTTGGGTRHTILGFETEAEAAGWAEADRERERFQLSFSTDAD
jgi:predicted N-acetyltransferase YhbS